MVLFKKSPAGKCPRCGRPLKTKTRGLGRLPGPKIAVCSNVKCTYTTMQK